jgi:ubiquinone/menaquinone biosynthesis C-methylase UbiE
VGFGSGVTFPNLATAYREIHGLDLTADVAAVAAMFAARGITTDLRNGSVLAMPYPDGHFDAVLLISILEHLRPAELPAAFAEIARVLRPGGRVVYGVPVERQLMVLAFRLLGYDIREHHFSTEDDVASAVATVGTLSAVRRVPMYAGLRAIGPVYEVGVATRT